MSNCIQSRPPQYLNMLPSISIVAFMMSLAQSSYFIVGIALGATLSPRPSALNEKRPRSIPQQGPDMTFTTGALCSKKDPDFMGRQYGINKCNRHFLQSDRTIISNHYGIVKEEYEQVEFDHLIPLGIGGSNAAHNVWPQPGPPGESQSGLKDAVERVAYLRLSSGEINQTEAVQMICDWLNSNYATTYHPSMWGLN